MIPAKIIIGITFLILVVLGSLMLKDTILSRKKETVSPSILTLTKPIYEMYGRVKQISGPTIDIETGGQDFQVIVDEKTTITSYPPSIPYLFKKDIPPSKDRLPKDALRVGDTLAVTSRNDLRTVERSTFEATNIMVLPPVNRIDGTVLDIGKETITVKGVPGRIAPFPIEETFGEEIFTVRLTPFTELSLRIPPADITAQSVDRRIALDDIKPNRHITIYTAEDVRNTAELTALLVQPFVGLPTASPTTSSITPSVRVED